MTSQTVTPGTYKHYKGGTYRVHFVAKLEATLEDAVVYETLYENSLGKYWVRPVKNWLESVEVNGVSQPRFTRIGN